MVLVDRQAHINQNKEINCRQTINVTTFLYFAKGSNLLSDI